MEEVTQVAENEKDGKVKKILALINKGVADLKKACKKAKDANWGAIILQILLKYRDTLEDLVINGELEGFLLPIKIKSRERSKILQQI